VSGVRTALRVLFALLLIALVGGGDFLVLRNYLSPVPQDVTGAWTMTVTTPGVAVQETLTLQQRGAQLSSALTRCVSGHAVSFPGMGRLSGSAITFDVATEFTRGEDENDQFTGAMSDATHMAGALTATILPRNGSYPHTVTGTWLAAKIAPRASRVTRTAGRSALFVQGRARTAVGLTPLTDRGMGTYQGFAGGLYPQGANQAPASYVQAGRARAAQVQPLAPDGAPTATDMVALLTIGESTTLLASEQCAQDANADPAKSGRLVIVNGAQGGQDAEQMKTVSAPYWQQWAPDQVSKAGVTANQAQSSWLKEAIIGDGGASPGGARLLQADRAAIGCRDVAQAHALRLTAVGGAWTGRKGPWPLAGAGA
jgi:hypothetical protein